MKTLMPLIAALLLCGCAQADPPPASRAALAPVVPAPAAIQGALTAHGITIAGRLGAPAGFEGFVGSYEGRELPVYVLPDSKHIVIGSLFDLAGNDLTSPAMAKIARAGLGEVQCRS